MAVMARMSLTPACRVNRNAAPSARWPEGLRLQDGPGSSRSPDGPLCPDVGRTIRFRMLRL
eukprot:12622098-Alexandrium_andersonii.AAC.1